jgi:thiamine kinase-like enzyme
MRTYCVVCTAAASGSPVLLTHNDAQPGNWMHRGAVASTLSTPAEDPLELIDYEYAGMNYRGFEFGNLFCEFGFDNQATVAPFFTYDPTKCPSNAVMRSMFEAYVANATGPAAHAGTLRRTIGLYHCTAV